MKQRNYILHIKLYYFLDPHPSNLMSTLEFRWGSQQCHKLLGVAKIPKSSKVRHFKMNSHQILISHQRLGSIHTSIL